MNDRDEIRRMIDARQGAGGFKLAAAAHLVLVELERRDVDSPCTATRGHEWRPDRWEDDVQVCDYCGLNRPAPRS